MYRESTDLNWLAIAGEVGHDVPTRDLVRLYDRVHLASSAFLNIYLKIKSIVKQPIVDCASQPCGFLHKLQRVIEAMNNSMQRREYLMLVVDFRRNIDTTFSFIHDTLNMGTLNDSHNLDEISYKNEKNMSDGSNDDKKSNAILISADILGDP
ncbi:unnamed protein product [Schistosoma margrebowiei]|uniref:Uncharacterized protein n=1 Tax=Schistosoma margrebowiei TaxID=48269 RepID=A0A183LSZ5_9TREM|nr:unnamed protein product [Schistosoma margrebowiei]